MNNPNLLDLIIEEQQAQEHRQLQNHLPAAPRGHPHDGWEIFFQRMGGVSSYQCINFAPRLRPELSRRGHPDIITSHQATVRLIRQAHQPVVETSA